MPENQVFGARGRSVMFYHVTRTFSKFTKPKPVKLFWILVELFVCVDCVYRGRNNLPRIHCDSVRELEGSQNFSRCPN